MMNNNKQPAYPDPAYAWYVVGILFLAYTISFVDRQIMSLLIEPIKRDLEINDTQISLLHGFAFVIFYTTLGIPLGRLADRKNRKAIISAGIFVWSFMTAVCGLAKNFWPLFLARIGVGVGEACLSPAAYSMISDYFPKEKRGVAISLYSMGIFFGAGLAYIAGGLVVQLAAGSHEIILPVVGQVRSWQLTFFIVGIPGLAVVALMATVREPFRRDLMVSGTGSSHISIAETVSYFLGHWKTYVTLIVGFSLMATLSYGFFTWVPSMFIRTFGWTASEIGFAFGCIVMTFGTGGIFFGGYIAEKIRARGAADAYLRVAMFGGIGVTLCGVSATLVPAPELSLLLLCPTVFCLGLPTGTGPAALNFMTPNQMRGQGIAIFYFVLNLMGLGLGPTTVAVFTDYVFRDEMALRYSLAIFSVIVGTVAFVSLWLGLKPFREAAQAISDSEN